MNKREFETELIIWPSKSTSKYLPKWKCIHAETYANVHNSFIRNSKNNQKSINWWTGKQIVVTPHNGILPSNKKEQSTDSYNNRDESQKHCIQ